MGTHRLVMVCLAVSHIIALGIGSMRFVTANKLKSDHCAMFHGVGWLGYIALNFLLMVYFSHLAKNAQTQSLDVNIFDWQKAIVRTLALLPSGLIAIHFLARQACSEEPIPLERTMPQWLHLTIELIAVSVYFGWYQNELRRYSGTENIELGVNKEHRETVSDPKTSTGHSGVHTNLSTTDVTTNVKQ